MKTKSLCFILLSLTGMFSKDIFAQDLRGRWGIGLGFNAQQFYPGDLSKNSGRAYGVDGLLSYHFFNRFGLALAAGYNPLLFALDHPAEISLAGNRGGVLRHYRTHLFFSDLKMDFDLLRGFFRPYLTAGGGILNFVVTGDSLQTTSFKGDKFIGAGIGVRFIIRSKMIFDLGVNYKQTRADLASGLRSGTHDSFFAWRSGLTLLFGKSGAVSASGLSELAKGSRRAGTIAKAAPVDSLAASKPMARVDSLASVPPASPSARASRAGETSANSVGPLTSSRKEAAGDSAAAKNGIFHYQPLSEAEISAAVQTPLKLDDCIRIALGKNFALRQAEYELDKAEALQAGTYSKFLPVFSLQGVQEYTREKRPPDPADSTARQLRFFENKAIVAQVVQKLPTGATVQVSADLRRDLNSPNIFNAPPTRTRNRLYSISVTQPLLRDAWPAMTRNSINIAQYERQNRDRQLLNAKWETVFAVKRAYYNVVLQRELIKVNQAAMLRDSTLVEASVSMSAAKLATRRDVLSAEIRLADDRAALIRAQTDYQLALDLLKEVMGIPPATPIDLSAPELRFAPVSLNEEALIQAALQNNPLLHGASFAIEVGKLQLREAKNTLLPQLDLIGSLSGRFDTNFDTNTDQKKDLQNYGGQVMLSLNYPLLSRDATARAEQAQINVSQQEERLLEQQRQLTLNIRSIVRSVYSGHEELNALQRSIVAAEQKVDFATTMFNLGRASNLDITDAQESLLRTQNLYARKLVDYYTKLALLESLTGQSIH